MPRFALTRSTTSLAVIGFLDLAPREVACEITRNEASASSLYELSSRKLAHDNLPSTNDCLQKWPPCRSYRALLPLRARQSLHPCRSGFTPDIPKMSGVKPDLQEPVLPYVSAIPLKYGIHAGSPAGIHSTGTSLTNDFSHVAISPLPGSSDTC